MARWIKTTDEFGSRMVILNETVSVNAAKRLGSQFLRELCGNCPWKAKGHYGLLYSEGGIGSRGVQPFRVCPGIGTKEAKC